MISQQRAAIKRLTKPKPKAAEARAGAEQESEEPGRHLDGGRKRNEPAKPMMPTNKQLVDAATANAAMSNGAATVSDGVRSWQLLQEPATTIGHG